MMRLVYPIYCGLDVHKNIIVATIVTTNNVGISEYNQKSFSTINSDIQKFHDCLIENDCYHVCMESTGNYWSPIWSNQKKMWLQKAIIAIARMMMICIYYMISAKQPFNPTDYEELMDPHY